MASAPPQTNPLLEDLNQALEAFEEAARKRKEVGVAALLNIFARALLDGNDAVLAKAISETQAIIMKMGRVGEDPFPHESLLDTASALHSAALVAEQLVIPKSLIDQLNSDDCSLDALVALHRQGPSPVHEISGLYGGNLMLNRLEALKSHGFVASVNPGYGTLWNIRQRGIDALHQLRRRHFESLKP